MKWVYCFNVWPDERRGFPPAVFELFKVQSGMIEMEFAEVDFEKLGQEKVL